jgi:hypothetical protein
MSEDEVSINEKEESYAGCYGSKVRYSALDMFLEDCFKLNEMAFENDSQKFATCIWGHAGIGKTEKIKQFASRKVTWKGKEYDGYNVIDIPLAQFEEMGDLHGLPEAHVRALRGDEEYWVPAKLMDSYVKDGWEIDASSGIRTLYAPPDWVPTEEGPCILLFDDFNRANHRMIRGTMQLFQNYGLQSWKLPPGCNIVMTGNPDEQDYLVTSIEDDAILTRMRHITLMWDSESAADWARWAEGENIDGRGISYMLAYPEMAIGKQRTNPRTLTDVMRALSLYKNLNDKESLDRFYNIAHGLLDEETVGSFVTFLERDVEMVIEPLDILNGRPMVADRVKDLMTRGEKRVDVIGVTCERLLAYVLRAEYTPSPEHIKNFQSFLTIKDLGEEFRHNMALRISRMKDGGKSEQLILNNNEIVSMIMELV